MKNVIFFLVGFLLVFGCINLDVPQEQIEKNDTEIVVLVPSFSITYPSNNIRIEVVSESNDVELLLKTSDITFKPAGNQNIAGQGHFVVKLDNEPQQEIYTENYVLEGVGLGKHMLLIEFVNNDGSPYSPRILKTIDFELYTTKPIEYKPATYNIDLEGNNFIPKELTIKETDVVIFNNFDAVAHGIKIGDIAIIPPIPKDMSGSYKFNKKGEYEISSLTIPTITGKIIVE